MTQPRLIRPRRPDETPPPLSVPRSQALFGMDGTGREEMSHGSVQLRQFRIAIRDGMTLEAAAEWAGISLGEAKLIQADDAANPPPAEAFELLGIGHNSQEKELMSDNVAGDELRLFVERLERLTEEKKGIQDDIKDVFAEAKSRGYDAPTMRWALKERAIDRQKRQERDAMRETYGAQLGLFD